MTPTGLPGAWISCHVSCSRVVTSDFCAPIPIKVAPLATLTQQPVLTHLPMWDPRDRSHRRALHHPMQCHQCTLYWPMYTTMYSNTDTHQGPFSPNRIRRHKAAGRVERAKMLGCWDGRMGCRGQ